jgi:cyclomaltodextrinase
VKPGVFDAVMNYAFFRDPVTKFLGQGQGTAGEFDGSLAQGRLAYPSQAVEAQMNLIDSHDTVRFLTQVNGNVNRLMLAAMFSMTYVGAPTIYYGDEVGMEGGKDPDCRRPMIWDWQKDPKRVALHDYYRRLTGIRHAHPALRTGDFLPVYANGMTYGYTRSDGNERFVVALNAGRTETEMPVDLAAWGGAVQAMDLMTGATEAWSGEARIKLAAETGRVFQILGGTGVAKPAPQGPKATTAPAAPARKPAAAPGTAVKKPGGAKAAGKGTSAKPAAKHPAAGKAPAVRKPAPATAPKQ